MKFAAVATLFLLAGFSQASSTDPIQKVLEMLSDLETKILKEGTDAQKVYDEFAEFCEDRSRELGFEIKTGKGEVASLQATIEKESSTIDSLNAKIDELSGAIAVDEADLKSAREIRGKEEATFVAEQAKLTESIDTLSRAIAIIEREMAKGGASMAQLKGAQSVAQALSVMVEATSLSTADASKLAALVQTSQESEDQDPGAPAAAVFKSSSGGVLDTLQGVFEEAEAQLADIRKTENQNVQAFQMMELTIEDEIKYGNEDLAKAKKALAKSEESKATAEGDLEVTSKDLQEDEASLAKLHQECMTGAEDFEAETKSRGEELKALATAKKVISETTSGAADLSYGAAFLQVSMSTGADLANFEAVRFVRDLAHKTKSTALTQLATRMAAAMRDSHRAGENPFAKVEGLIQDMIERLEKEGEADATEKAFCDKEMHETETKKADKEEEIAKLTTSIDSMTAKSNQLKEQVAVLQKELAELARAQAEMDKVRAEEKALYDTSSAEMKQGIEGVKMALKVLNEYYSKEGKDHGAAEGAGAGIIGLLEVCESDFTQGLAEMTAAEESAAKGYDQTTKENEITKATKEQDVKYKTKEFKGLDKETAEATSDRSGVQEELDAVNEYLSGLKERCIAKPETYEERVKRRTAELAGLKQALEILNGEAVLLQRTSKHALRGVRAHSHA